MLKNIQYICNSYIALFLYMFSPSKKKNFWLIGGHNGRLYTDNSKVFYEFLLEAKNKDIICYWVMNKDAPAYDTIPGKKLIKGSIKSYYYFYKAEVCLFSDTLNSDIAPLAFILPLVKRMYNKIFKVYLSHGTISFKKMQQPSGFVGKIKKSIFASYNLAMASTKLEVKVMEEYGVKKNNIVLAGSARNDSIFDNSLLNEKIILVAPTWRKWLVEKESIKNTEYYDAYSNLLSNKKLLVFLEKNNIQIYFYLHHMLQQFIKEFDSLNSKNVKILSAGANISQMISAANLLITDYSSISADFYYLKKPIIFYHFDRDLYIEKIGSEIDLINERFGDICMDVTSLVDKIITQSLNPHISENQIHGEQFFSYFHDKNNCQRIYQEITNRLK